jgi:hypothetical protein
MRRLDAAASRELADCSAVTSVTMATQDGEIKVVKGITPVFIVDGFNFCRQDCTHYFLSECRQCQHMQSLAASRVLRACLPWIALEPSLPMFNVLVVQRAIDSTCPAMGSYWPVVAHHWPLFATLLALLNQSRCSQHIATCTPCLAMITINTVCSPLPFRSHDGIAPNVRPRHGVLL